MQATKSRISALDWARAEALGQIKSLVARYSDKGPSEWTWNVGRLLKDDPHIIVTISDKEMGLTASHLMQVTLPYLRLEDEIKYLFEKMSFQRHCVLVTIDQKKRKKS